MMRRRFLGAVEQSGRENISGKSIRDSFRRNRGVRRRKNELQNGKMRNFFGGKQEFLEFRRNRSAPTRATAAIRRNRPA